MVVKLVQKNKSACFFGLLTLFYIFAPKCTKYGQFIILYY